MVKKVPVINKPDTPLTDRPHPPSGPYYPTTELEEGWKNLLDDALSDIFDYTSPYDEKWEDYYDSLRPALVWDELQDQVEGETLDVEDAIDTQLIPVNREDIDWTIPPDSDPTTNDWPDPWKPWVPEIDEVPEPVGTEPVALEVDVPSEDEELDDIDVDDEIHITIDRVTDKKIIYYTPGGYIEIPINDYDAFDPCEEYRKEVNNFNAQKKLQDPQKRFQRSKNGLPKRERTKQAVRTHYYFKDRRRQLGCD